MKHFQLGPLSWSLSSKCPLYLHAFLPADPQVSSGEETSNRMPGQVVDPAFLPQLGHDGINPGKTSPALGPLGQSFWVLVPRDLHANRVALHLVKARVVCGGRVKKFTPK